MSSYRELELLVSRIEGALAPAGARIRSPDRIPDISTGDLREVDVSIRHRVGSVELLVTVECRDRNSRLCAAGSFEVPCDAAFRVVLQTGRRSADRTLGGFC